MKPTVALTGASGGIGQTLLPLLFEHFEVRALFRQDGGAAEGARRLGCEVVAGSLSDDAALDRLVRGASAVIHCAASVTRALGSAHATNVDGTRRLAQSAVAAGCRRFVHLSSIAVYLGNQGVGEAFPEEIPVHPNDQMDIYSRTKLLGEQVLREVAARSPLEIVVLRPTCVYGPLIDSWTLIPLAAVAKGLPMLIGDGRGQIDVIHVDDVARAIVLAATSENAAGETFNLGGQPLSDAEFLGYYARMSGRELVHLPTAVFEAILAAGSVAARVVPFPALAEPNRLRLLKFCCDAQPGRAKFPSTKIRTRLKFEPAVSIAEGMLRTHLWLERHGFIRTRRAFQHAERNYQFRPALTVFPENDAALREIVQFAVEQNRRVRVVGSLHSMAPLAATNDVCVSLERYASPVRIEGDRATVQAGMKLCDLNDNLAANGLALPILGAIAEQTVSGAISTGTHGGSLAQGSLADAVDSIRIVTGSGEVVTLDRSDERFFGAVLSLGLCGIFSEVTLRAVPAFWLRSEVAVLPLEQVLEEFDVLQRDHEFCDMTWYPILDRVEVMLSRRSTNRVENRELKPARHPGASRWTRPAVQSVLKAFHAGRMQGWHRRVAQSWAGSGYPAREGRSDYVLAYMTYVPSGIPTADTELAVPIEKAVAAIRALRDHFVESRKFPVLGLRIRCQRAEPFWMSGAYERNVCWIEMFHQQPAGDFLRQVHELLQAFDYRPHWGKTIHPAGDYWPGVIPLWKRFHALCREFDPHGIFVNDYAATHLGAVADR